MTYFRLEDRIIAARSRWQRIADSVHEGEVAHIQGLIAEVVNLPGIAALGDRIELVARSGAAVHAEVIGFRDGAVQVMAYGTLDGIAQGSRAVLHGPLH